MNIIRHSRILALSLITGLAASSLVSANEFADNINGDQYLDPGSVINGSVVIDAAFLQSNTIVSAALSFTFSDDENDATQYLSSTSSSTLNTQTQNGVRTATRTITVTENYNDIEIDQVVIQSDNHSQYAESSSGSYNTLADTITDGPTPVANSECFNTNGYYTRCQNVTVTKTYHQVAGKTGTFQSTILLGAADINRLQSIGSVSFSITGTEGDLYFNAANLILETQTVPPINADSYTLLPLDGLLNAKGLNDHGAVAGQIASAQTSDAWPHAALWDNGATTDLGMVGCRDTVSHCWSQAYSINNKGELVGESHTADSWPSQYWAPWGIYYAHEAYWASSESAPHLMRTLGWEYGTTLDINENSHAAGHGRSVDWRRVSGDYIVHGFLWRNDNDVVEIGDYGQYSKAFSLNDGDQLTGEISVNGVTQGYLWDNGVLTLLNGLGGGRSAGLDINNNAIPKIVGYATNATGVSRATLWQANNATDLGALPGASSSQATAINDAGSIVGNSANRAVLWQDGQIIDLNSLIDPNANLTLLAALDINQSGQILVQSNSGYYILNPDVIPTADVTVCPVGCDHTSIQAGLDAALTGEEVLVLPGTYNEAVNVNSGKQLTSWKGPNNTTIDASGLNSTTVTLSNGNVEGFTIRGGTANYGAGVYIHRGTIEGNVISNNQANTSGGGVYVRSYTSGTILNNTIENNAATYGGGIAYSSYTTVVIDANTFKGNSATYGGAVYFASYANETFNNNIVTQNTATYGGGLFIPGYSGIAVINSTVVANTATTAGGIYISSYSGSRVTNTIVWNNTGGQLSSPYYGRPAVRYSLVQGGYSGTGNIDTDPQFVDPANDDYQLLSHSVAIDSGSDTSADGVTTDIVGNIRPQDGDGLGAGSTGDGSDFDIGAYEFQ